jgi:cholera toxin transcriptional activator
MNYVINREIIFRADLKTLSLYEEKETSITLSNQATRLLIEFIKGNKTPLSKEQLLKNVWEDYGLSPSNNNLYMAVSEIRKSFVNLGIDDVIISTIPKNGFIFSASVDILESTSDETEQREESKGGVRKLKIKTISSAISIIILLVFAFIFLINKNNIFESAITPVKISKTDSYGNCKFYSLNSFSEKYLPKIIDKLKKDEKLDCSKENKSIYYQTDNKTFTFIGLCDGDTSNLNDCESYRATTGI